jgi:transposase
VRLRPQSQTCGNPSPPNGFWFITIAVDVMDQPKADSNASVGIDFGLKTFATLSDAGKIPKHITAKPGTS